MARVKVVTLSKEPLGRKMKKAKKSKNKGTKKTRKSKHQAKKKEIPIGPRLRLEPRLSPSNSPKSIKDKKNLNSVEKNETETVIIDEESGNPISTNDSFKLMRLEPLISPISTPKRNNKKTVNFEEKDESEAMIIDTKPGNSLSSNVSLQHIKLPDTIKFESDSNDMSVDDISFGDNTYKTVRKKIDFLKSSGKSTQVSASSAKVQWRPKLKIPRRDRGPFSWNDRELLDLASGLQFYGFQDMQKLAEFVKTKNEKEVREYLRLHSRDARHNVTAEKTNEAIINAKAQPHRKQKGRPMNKWCNVSPEHLTTWPNVRKWRRMAFDQMLACCRTKDFSKTVIASLIKRFHDEEEEPTDPQVIDIKAIYKYLMDCLSCQIPAQLPPKESILVMDLLRDLRLLPMVYDFEEETKFLESYTEATRYKPIEMKDEFKKRIVKTENTDDDFSTNCVSVPEEVFAKLSMHKRLVQSFNPLMIPVWMMQKEQEYMGQFL